MPWPRRPVSPVPEGPAEEDQPQPWKRLGLEEEARKTGIIFRADKVWEGGKMEEVGEIFFFFGEWRRPGSWGVWRRNRILWEKEEI